MAISNAIVHPLAYEVPNNDDDLSVPRSFGCMFDSIMLHHRNPLCPNTNKQGQPQKDSPGRNPHPSFWVVP